MSIFDDSVADVAVTIKSDIFSSDFNPRPIKIDCRDNLTARHFACWEFIPDCEGYLVVTLSNSCLNITF